MWEKITEHDMNLTRVRGPDHMGVKMFKHMYMFRLVRMWKMFGYHECWSGKNTCKEKHM